MGWCNSWKPFWPTTNLNEQSSTDCETSDHPPWVYVLEGVNKTVEPAEDDDFIMLINVQEWAPLSIHFDESNCALDTSGIASFAVSCNPLNLILHIHAKASKSGSIDWVISKESTSSPVPLDQCRFQVVSPDSTEQNSGRNVNILELVSPFWMNASNL